MLGFWMWSFRYCQIIDIKGLKFSFCFFFDQSIYLFIQTFCFREQILIQKEDFEKLPLWDLQQVKDILILWNIWQSVEQTLKHLVLMEEVLFGK